MGNVMGHVPGCSGGSGDIEAYEIDASGDISKAVLVMDASELQKQLRYVGLEDLLARNGGLLKVTNILPEEEAHSVLNTLKTLPEAEYLSKGGWYQSKNVQPKQAPHSFFRYDGDAIDDLKRTAISLCPTKYGIFSGGKYLQGGHISIHNDAAGVPIPMNDKWATARHPVGQKIYRKIAMIYYFTENWSVAYGGCLVDRFVPHDPKLIVPEFNSLVMFLVPRDHEVTEMYPGSPARYTMFGWLCDDEAYSPGSRRDYQHKAMQRVHEIEDQSTTDDEALASEFSEV
jgi:hypothetical protein